MPKWHATVQCQAIKYFTGLNFLIDFWKLARLSNLSQLIVRVPYSEVTFKGSCSDTHNFEMIG